MGSLVSRTGLDLSLSEQLEKAHRTRYDQIIPFMREEDLEPSFYTTKQYCNFVDDVDMAEVIIFLLNVKMSKPDATDILKLADTGKAAQRGVKFVVIVDRLQDADWAGQPYEDLVASVEITIKEGCAGAKGIRFVPISSMSGDNLLDLSEKSPWYSQQVAASGHSKLPHTVVGTIDY